MPHHVNPPSTHHHIPFHTSHQTSPPGAEMACLMGFHLVGNRRSAEDRRLWSNPDISYSIRLFFLFLSLGCREGGIPVQIDITITHTHVHLILYRPFVLMFFCPMCIVLRHPYRVYHLCRVPHVCLFHVFHVCLYPATFVSVYGLVGWCLQTLAYDLLTRE
jgi:hypothetical protein